MLLAQRIKLILEAHSLTQNDVAERCGISPSADGQFERQASKCKIETLSKVAFALNVSLPFLVDSDNKNVKEMQNKL